MDSVKYFCKTNIPCPPVRWKEVWNLDPADPINTKPRWKISSHLIKWDPEITKIFKKLNLTVEIGRIFRWRANDFFPWHIDGDPNLPTLFAINWILDGAGTIQWKEDFKLRPHGNQGAYAYTTGKIDDQFDIETDGHGCIVNTFIPHRVVNLNPIHRVTLSVTFRVDYDYFVAFEKLKSVGLLEL